MKTLKKIFYFFIQYFKRKKFKKFEKSLEKAFVNKLQEQISLMKLIKQEIDLLWPKGRSKHIPLSYPQRIELHAKVHSKFGEQMQKLNVKLNKNLQFK